MNSAHNVFLFMTLIYEIATEAQAKQSFGIFTSSIDTFSIKTAEVKELNYHCHYDP